MISIILSGCSGHMGQAVIRKAREAGSDFNIIAGVDIQSCADCLFPVYPSFSDISTKADVIVDFSHHSVLPALCAYAAATKTPAVICTTGHTEDELAVMKKTSEQVGIFHSGNMSLGINLLIRLSKQAAAILGKDYDIEIVEKHHNRKLDAPSGTALMIANAVSEATDHEKNYVYDRHSRHEKRSPDEIGISSVRGGNLAGVHDIMFLGDKEVLTISHEALSRDLFADGALKAAAFMKGKKPGIYDMDLLLSDLL